MLDAFPTTPINIEIKMEKTLQNADPASGCTGTPPNRYCDDVEASMDTATALAAVLDSPDYAWRNDIIVVSFSDELIQEFHDQDDLPKVTLPRAPATPSSSSSTRRTSSPRTPTWPPFRCRRATPASRA